MLAALWGCTSSPPPQDTGPAEPPPEEAPRPPVELALPLADPSVILLPMMGMDHDPEEQSGLEAVVCTNYAGEVYPYCYDGHSGSDFTLKGGFAAMDAGSTEILAAAPGVVVEVRDGNYDRCHVDLATFGVDCDGHPVRANGVILEHEGGWRTLYLHMMNGTPAVEVGDAVERGQYLGLVGSSGWSTSPHLHLGLEDPEGRDVDPYAGAFSQEMSFWCDQGRVDGLPGGCDAEG